MKSGSVSEDDVFTAVAHPIRRQLLDLLAGGERPVGELAARFSVTRPAISQHLRVLRDAGLVAERRQGRERIYRLVPGPLQALDDWLAAYRSLWDDRLDRLEDYLQELQKGDKRDGDDER